MCPKCHVHLITKKKVYRYKIKTIKKEKKKKKLMGGRATPLAVAKMKIWNHGDDLIMAQTPSINITFNPQKLNK